jgi:hypothetical protein
MVNTMVASLEAKQLPTATERFKFFVFFLLLYFKEE